MSQLMNQDRLMLVAQFTWLVSALVTGSASGLQQPATIIMAALWNRVGHYIFALWYLLLLLSIYLSFVFLA